MLLLYILSFLCTTCICPSTFCLVVESKPQRSQWNSLTFRCTAFLCVGKIPFLCTTCISPSTFSLAVESKPQRSQWKSLTFRCTALLCVGKFPFLCTPCICLSTFSLPVGSKSQRSQWKSLTFRCSALLCVGKFSGLFVETVVGLESLLLVLSSLDLKRFLKKSTNFELTLADDALLFLKDLYKLCNELCSWKNLCCSCLSKSFFTL